MKQPIYSNKAVTHRYICANCQHDAGNIETFTINSFVPVPCSICGNVGLHARVSESSYDKAVKALMQMQGASK